jgi:hypothetical protein
MKESKKMARQSRKDIQQSRAAILNPHSPAAAPYFRRPRRRRGAKIIIQSFLLIPERSFHCVEMPLWLKRCLLLLVVGAAASVEGYYLAPFGFGTVAVALVTTVILAIGWMRTLLEEIKGSRGSGPSPSPSSKLSPACPRPL